MTLKQNLEMSHLLKLMNALFGLASLIKQWNLLHSKKETISADEKMNEFILIVKSIFIYQPDFFAHKKALTH